MEISSLYLFFAISEHKIRIVTGNEYLFVIAGISLKPGTLYMGYTVYR